jgi:ABC-2 type transport system ATP-binding protein
VLGPNGAGKTTFVRAVATLLRWTQERCAWPATTSAASPRPSGEIGLAGQFAAIEPGDERAENLEMVARLFGQTRRTARASASAVLEQIGLSESADRLARTYWAACAAGSIWVRVSSARHVCCCRTGADDRADPRSRSELWDAIRALVAKGTDVLLTTQYLDEADHLASQIVIIDHGRAVAQGTSAELKRRVGGNVIEVHARSRAHLSTVAGAFFFNAPAPTEIDTATRRVTIGVTSTGDDLTSALRSIEATGVQIDDIALRQPTLDEVFLALTGQPMTEQDPGRARGRGGLKYSRKRITHGHDRHAPGVEIRRLTSST